jgi:adenylosuccinate synthase
MKQTKVDVLLGLQWGDEGKGKVVDVMTPEYDIIARFQGGPNAGHTLEFNNFKQVLHTIPSGIFREDKLNIIGNGVVIDPIVFKKEIETIRGKGFNISKNLVISKKAHLILPTHRLLDIASEEAKGDTKIGSTLKGIGPTYRDKIGREGLRVGDIFHDFDTKYSSRIAAHKQILEKMYGFDYKERLESCEKEWFEGIECLKTFDLIDSEQFINSQLDKGKTMLAEGAQGTLLDIDFGSYPYVTSSNTVCAGACTGLGLAPGRIGKVIGIFKAYCTRVGSGPFPTELKDKTGDLIREAGNEFGSTTGRPRRCGWLDLVALKYSVMLNGTTEMIMMKADVLSQFDMIKVCVGYEIDGKVVEQFPYEIDENLKPVYVDLPGWNTDLTQFSSQDEFPEELNYYIHFIEEEVGVPVTVVSVGPRREQSVFIGD